MVCYKPNLANFGWAATEANASEFEFERPRPLLTVCADWIRATRIVWTVLLAQVHLCTHGSRRNCQTRCMEHVCVGWSASSTLALCEEG